MDTLMMMTRTTRRQESNMMTHWCSSPLPNPHPRFFFPAGYIAIILQKYSYDDIIIIYVANTVIQWYVCSKLIYKNVSINIIAAVDAYLMTILSQ